MNKKLYIIFLSLLIITQSVTPCSMEYMKSFFFATKILNAQNGFEELKELFNLKTTPGKIVIGSTLLLVFVVVTAIKKIFYPKVKYKKVKEEKKAEVEKVESFDEDGGAEVESSNENGLLKEIIKSPQDRLKEKKSSEQLTKVIERAEKKAVAKKIVQEKRTKEDSLEEKEVLTTTLEKEAKEEVVVTEVKSSNGNGLKNVEEEAKRQLLFSSIEQFDRRTLKKIETNEQRSKENFVNDSEEKESESEFAEECNEDALEKEEEAEVGKGEKFIAFVKKATKIVKTAIYLSVVVAVVILNITEQPIAITEPAVTGAKIEQMPLQICLGPVERCDWKEGILEKEQSELLNISNNG